VCDRTRLLGDALERPRGYSEAMVVASVINDIAPFAVFGAFMLLFTIQARRRGQSVDDYLYARNRETFTNLKPGWWRLPVAFAAAAWAVLWIASGFKLVLLVALPVVVLWIPVWTLVFRAYFRRR
jgi:hypothetical protein